jgi:hypothetical protein
MINAYVVKLIENLPDEIKNTKEPIVIDLVLDGGAFNGSYLVGALYFLKEMENKKYIKVDRISGCSIGSIVAFLYHIDRLDLMSKLYEIIYECLKQSHSLKAVKDLKKHLGDIIPVNICSKVNNKLFVTYYNIKKRKKTVKQLYKNTDEIINALIRSSFIPFLIDGNLLYENTFVDGLSPFIFKNEPNKKILYLNLLGFDKVGNMLNVKNEKSNFHRILSGLLDIHTFFIKQSPTQMCSFVDEWNIINRLSNKCKIVFEKCCIYMIYLFMFINNKFSNELSSYINTNNIFCKILSKIIQDICVILLEKYCF